MDTTIVEGRSISKLPYLDGTTNFTEWKERIKIFIQSIDSDLWLVIENGPKIPKKIIDGEELVKTEDEFNDEDMKIMEQDKEAKYILCCALNPDVHRSISSCQTAKEMWEKLNEKVAIILPKKRKVAIRTHLFQETLRTPNLEFLDETSDHPNKRFLDLCVPIHKHALNGNWPAAKRILDKENKLRNAAITNRWLTLLHIAAGANHIHFVEQLLQKLNRDDIELQDIKGNTALCFAAAAGNMEIVDLMLKRCSPDLPFIVDDNGYGPVHNAALRGRYKMTWYLYDKIKDDLDLFHDHRDLLFFSCIYTGIYDLALELVRSWKELAGARDENGKTALHLLTHNPIMANPDRERGAVDELVDFLRFNI